MPSTYDPLLRLEKQAVAENANTWGDKLNENYVLAAEAIAGYSSIAVGGSGSYSLSVANAPTSDEARKAILALTGTLTGNRTIVIPSISKVYFFRLATTGAYTVTVKTATGTGVVLSSSNVNCVVCDGTDCYFASETNRVNRAGDTMTGTLTIATGNLSVSTGNVNAQAGKLTEGGYSLIPPGMIMPYAGASAPGGWLLCYGQSLSTSTYATLFAALGYTYGGSGASFTLPDLRGRTIFGKDDMGGTAASRLTTAISNVDGTTLGAAGGDQRSQLHTHVLTDTGHSHSITDVQHGHSGTTSSGGGHYHDLAGRAGVVYNAGSGAPANPGFGTYADSLYQTDSAGAHTHSFNTGNAYTGITATNATAANALSATITVATAGAGSSQNIPPALVLNYIIKT
jgi:microcystin-dependent protein